MIEATGHLLENPINNAGILSRLFFCWLDSLIRKGYKQTLTGDDMYNVTEENSSEYLGDKLEREWKAETEKKKPSLAKALWRCFGARIGWIGIVMFLEEAIRLAQPFLLVRLLAYFSADGERMAQLEAYMYALGLALTSMLMIVMRHPYFFYNGVTGMQMRVACTSIIYRKSLRLNNKALAQTTTGHIINLMTNDVTKLDYVTFFVHCFWVGPLQAAVVLIILWHYIGPSALAGFALLAVATALQSMLGKAFSRLRLRTAVKTDERVRLMEQMIAGMKVVKMYCWEKPFIKLVAAARSSELSRVFKVHMAKMPYTILPMVLPKLCVFLCCVTYIGLGNGLRIDVIFMLLANFEILKSTIFFSVPVAVSQVGEARATISRLQDFLLLDEVSESMTLPRLPASSDERGVSLVGVSAKWVASTDILTLQNVTASVKAGELLAVVGAVGAGKSSLLMAALGELPCTSGRVDVLGSMAYAPQQAWIFSGTVRQNILIGKPFVAAKYEQVIHCCALEKDLQLLPCGDQTLVGDRGVALSGGQRARIGLARAVYCDADVYLLDDPLSAVDAAVSRHLFSECIDGVLKDRARILVTHQLQYLKAATRVVILKDGAVLALGCYDQLVSSGIEIAHFLQHSPDTAEQEFPSSDGLEAVTEPTATHGLSAPPLSSEASPASVHPPCLQAAPSPTCNDGVPNYFPSSISIPSQLRSSRGSLSPAVAFEGATIHHCNELDEEDVQSTLLVTCEAPESAKSPRPQQLLVEQVGEGTVSPSAYTSYFTAGAKALTLVLTVILYLVSQGALVTCDWWLTLWSAKEEAYSRAETVAILQSSEYKANFLNFSHNGSTSPDVNTTDDLLSSHRGQNSIDLYIYISLMITSVILCLLRVTVFFKICIEASKNLHSQMFISIVRSPMRFFDTNPAGRILNRFSKDIGNIDEMLPITFYDFFTCFLVITGALVVASAINPWVLIPMVPIVGLFLFIRKLYISTSRAIKRLEGATRSPVISHLNATLTGLYSVRAIRMQGLFATEFDKRQDLHSETWYLFLAASRWLAIRLDWLCIAFITAATFFSVVAKDNIGLSPNLVGLIITYAISLVGAFQWGVRQSAEIENFMTSVERVLEYIKLPSEAPLQSDFKPPINWPAQGTIAVKDACLQYSQEDPFVLNNVTFHIRDGEKIGICGRTGAGKSSLLAMLFRLCEHTGQVTVDDVDIAKIGLHELRSKISIIPQEPILFGGTVRYNLDPFGEHSDVTLKEALAQVQLLSAVEELPNGISATMAENGSNFSVGQQQLFCLARALLRKNRILVVDEATANVDPRTDGLIQETIKQRFRSLTVLTIAHRLNTIIDSDRVLVLDEGRVREFDEPYVLMQRPGSLFSQLVKQMGSKEFDALEAVARTAYESRHSPNASPNDHLLIT